jgi:hypothetical protein
MFKAAWTAAPEEMPTRRPSSFGRRPAIARASSLKRDLKSVRRDVRKLESYGVLRTREQINPGHGRVRIVEPVAECFELRASF